MTEDMDPDLVAERVGPMPAGGWPCSNCGTPGADCLYDLNREGSRCCGYCGLADLHGDTSPTQLQSTPPAEQPGIACPLRCGQTRRYEAEMDAHVLRCNGPTRTR